MSEPEDFTLALPRGGIDRLHDTLVELHYHEDPNRAFSEEDVLAVWRSLPRELRLEAHRWGIDTVVGDEIFVHLKETRGS